MKPTLILQAVIAILLVSGAANAVNFGVPSVAGNGCSSTSSAIFTPIQDQPNRYSLNNQLMIIKKLSPAVVRKSCQFRLPVQLASNEKLVVSEVAQYVRLNTSKNTGVNTSLEIFLAGKRGTPLTSELKGDSSNSHVAMLLEAHGIVAESACGGEVILAGNVSASAVGIGRAVVSTSDVQLSLEIKGCRN